MQPSAETAESPASPSFAGLLAAIAAKRAGVLDDRASSEGWRNSAQSDEPPSAEWKKSGIFRDRSKSEDWKSAPVWNDDDLGEDVATLSYERALRTHARYRAADLSDRSLTQPAEPLPINRYELAPDETHPAAEAVPAPVANKKLNQSSEATRRPSTLCEQNLKNASITIRMSKEECAQLHKRAEEAGLTMSAYLRSCTFEAESLRALVKDTMAQLKSATAAGKPTVPAATRTGWFGRFKQFFSPWHGNLRTVSP